MMLTVILYIWNFIRTILFIVVAYYLIKLISKGYSSLVNKNSGRPGNQRQQGPRSNRPEGDVRVENNSGQGSRIPKDEGEYVDFEEID